MLQKPLPIPNRFRRGFHKKPFRGEMQKYPFVDAFLFVANKVSKRCYVVKRMEHLGVYKYDYDQIIDIYV